MIDVVRNFKVVESRITEAAKRCGRKEGAVRLVAVSKTWPAEYIQPVIDAGQRVLGENKLQEGLEKIPTMSGEIEWHYIGGLQRNKVRKVLPLFAVVHSIDSKKLACYVDGVAKDLCLRPRVLLQVNIGDEESKGGFEVGAIRNDFEELLELENIKLCGLMCIPPAVENPDLARPYFRKLRELRDDLEALYGCELPELSMGMSGDYEVAIEEGATLVRVGSSIFGSRSYPDC